MLLNQQAPQTQVIKVIENLSINGNFIVNKEGYVLMYGSDFEHFKTNNVFTPNFGGFANVDSVGQGYDQNGTYSGMATFDTPYQDADMKAYNAKLYEQNKNAKSAGPQLGKGSTGSGLGAPLGGSSAGVSASGNGPSVNDLMSLVNPTTSPATTPETNANTQLDGLTKDILDTKGQMSDNLGTETTVSVGPLPDSVVPKPVSETVRDKPSENSFNFDFDESDPKTISNYTTLLSTVKLKPGNLIIMDARIKGRFFSKAHWREFLKANSKFGTPTHLDSTLMAIVISMFGEQKPGIKVFLKDATETELRDLFLMIGDLLHVDKEPGEYNYYMDFNLMACGESIGNILSKDFNGTTTITDTDYVAQIKDVMKNKDMEKPTIMFYDNIAHYMSFKDDVVFLQRYLA